MATVVAVQSFVGVLENDVLGPDRIEKHSQFTEPSVFPGGKGFGAGSLERVIVKHGRKIEVVKGQRFENNHPAVKKWPEMFSGAPDFEPPVETATAAPGEKRNR